MDILSLLFKESNIVSNTEFSFSFLSGITGVSRDFHREIIKVNYEGIRNFYHTPTVLSLNNLPRQVNEYDITVPEQFILPLSNTWDYIAHSATCEIFISGDVAGPYFLLGYDEWLNTDNMMQKTTAPSDSGLFDFAMMIYNLRYMLQGLSVFVISVSYKMRD